MESQMLIAEEPEKIVVGDIKWEPQMVDSESFEVDQTALKLAIKDDYHGQSDEIVSNRIESEQNYGINWNGCHSRNEEDQMPTEKIWLKTEMSNETFEDREITEKVNNREIHMDARAKLFLNSDVRQKIPKRRHHVVSEKTSRKTVEQDHPVQEYPFRRMCSHSDLNKKILDMSGAYRYHEGQQSSQEEQPPSFNDLGDIPRQGQNALPNVDGCENVVEASSLEKILQAWGLEELGPYFIQQKITIEVLKIIKRHHIEKLFRDVPIGTQVIFEHNLENWRKAIGNPLDNTLQNDFNVLNFVQQPCSPIRSTSTSSSHPYLPRQETTDAEAKISLADILNTVKGRLLCSFYETNQKFEEEQRNALINLISQYFDEKQIPMSLATSYKIEREIMARFKNEKLEYYRTKKRGKIYNKCSNQKKITTDRVLKKLIVKKSRLKGDYVPENGAEDCLKALQFENLSAEKFDSYWKACAQYRLNDIKTMSSSAEVFQKWPFYKQPCGYRLVDIDYEIAFGNRGLLLNNWEKCVSPIVKFLQKDGHIKDKAARALLDKAFKETCNENGKYASILWAIHGYLVPAAKFCSKNLTGKTTHTKYTIKDSQESFLFCAKMQDEVEEHIINLKARKSVIPPFLICVGDDISNISNVYVYFDDIRYHFIDIIKAVDICFKIIYIFNLDFPQESKMFWNFLEKAFYKHDVPLESPKVHMICESLLQ